MFVDHDPLLGGKINFIVINNILKNEVEGRKSIQVCCIEPAVLPWEAFVSAIHPSDCVLGHHRKCFSHWRSLSIKVCNTLIYRLQEESWCLHFYRVDLFKP